MRSMDGGIELNGRSLWFRTCMIIKPQLEDVVTLLLAAEEANPGVLRLAWYLVGRDPLTGPRLADLQKMASDARITVGAPHWALSTFELHRQADRLMSSDGRTWKRSADLLDPERVIGMDQESLIAILTARIGRFTGDTSRLRRVRARLIKEVAERS